MYPRLRSAVVVAAANNNSPNKPTSVSREMLAIGIPALVGLAIEPVASLVDTALVGRLCGSADLAGAGVAVAVFNLVAKTFNFLSPATTSMVAGAAAETISSSSLGERGEFSPPMARVASSASAVALSIGSILTLVIVACADPLLTTLGVQASSAVRAPARAYLIARAAGAPATLMLLALQGAFRGARDTATPLRALMMATLLNLLLDPILIAQRGLGWGVAGAAVATTVSNIAAVLMLARKLATRCGEECYIDGRGGFGPLALLGLPPPAMAECRKLALAGSFLTARTLGVVGAISYSSIAAARLGTTAGAAHQICIQLWFATSLLSDAVAIAAQSLLASCLAVADQAGASRVVRQSFAVGVLAGVVTMGGMLIGGPLLRSMFTADAAVLSAAAAVWPLVVASLPFNTLAFTVDGLLYGANDFRFCALMMVSSSLPAIAIMGLGTRTAAGGGGGLGAVWLGLTLLMAMRSLLGISRIVSRSGPWAALQRQPQPP